MGGAIEFARLDSAGLPAEEAVAVIPTSNLIVIGANTLAPAVVAALVVTALFYTFHFIWRVFLRPHWPGLQRGLRSFVGKSAGATDFDAHTPKPQMTPAVPQSSIGLVLIIALAEILTFLYIQRDWGRPQLIVLIGLGLLTLVLSGVVAERTSRTLLLAATAWLSVATFVAVLGYARELDSFKVRPAAVVRQNQKAITGFFIAESSDRVYLGRRIVSDSRDQRAADTRIVAFSKDEISDLAEGPLMAPSVAYGKLDALAQELCRLQIPRVAADVDPRERNATCWR